MIVPLAILRLATGQPSRIGAFEFAYGAVIHADTLDYTIRISSGTQCRTVASVPDRFGCYRVQLRYAGGISIEALSPKYTGSVERATGNILSAETLDYAIHLAPARCDILSPLPDRYGRYRVQIRKPAVVLEQTPLPEHTGFKDIFFGEIISANTLDFAIYPRSTSLSVRSFFPDRFGRYRVQLHHASKTSIRTLSPEYTGLAERVHGSILSAETLDFAIHPAPARHVILSLVTDRFGRYRVQLHYASRTSTRALSPEYTGSAERVSGNIVSAETLDFAIRLALARHIILSSLPDRFGRYRVQLHFAGKAILDSYPPTHVGVRDKSIGEIVYAETLDFAVHSTPACIRMSFLLPDRFGRYKVQLHVAAQTHLHFPESDYVGRKDIAWGSILLTTTSILMNEHTAPPLACDIYSATLAASGGFDTAIYVWNPDSEEVLRVITGYSRDIRSIKIFDDGQRLVSASDDGLVRIHSINTGELLGVFEKHTDDVFSVDAHGTRVVSAGRDGRVLIWDADTLQIELELIYHTDAVFCVRFSGSGNRIISAGADKIAIVWDAVSGDLIRILSGHSSYVSSAALNETGSVAITGSWDRTVRLWDINTGKTLRILPVNHYVMSVDITPSGDKICFGGYNGVFKVLDLSV